MKNVSRLIVRLVSPLLAVVAVLTLAKNARVTPWAAASSGRTSNRNWWLALDPWPFLAHRDASGEQEWMDLPGRDPNEMTGMFGDLRRVNRWLGGTRLTYRALDRMFAGHSPGRTIQILDVASGSVDIPTVMSGWGKKRERNVSIVATDNNTEVLAQFARREQYDDIQVVAADALRLPFSNDAFDVAACSFFLHHLEPDDVVTALREMRRVSRQGVLINDMVRGRVSYLGAWAFSRIFTRNPISRHDAPLSARRSYSRDELIALAARAGLEPVASHGFFGYRVAIVACDRVVTPRAPMARAGDRQVIVA